MFSTGYGEEAEPQMERVEEDWKAVIVKKIEIGKRNECRELKRSEGRLEKMNDKQTYGQRKQI